MSDSVRPHGLWPARVLCPWDSPGKNTRVGCHALLRHIFLTQGLNLGLMLLADRVRIQTNKQVNKEVNPQENKQTNNLCPIFLAGLLWTSLK